MMVMATSAPRLASALGPTGTDDSYFVALACLKYLISCVVEPVVVGPFKDLGSHKTDTTRDIRGLLSNVGSHATYVFLHHNGLISGCFDLAFL